MIVPVINMLTISLRHRPEVVYRLLLYSTV